MFYQIKTIEDIMLIYHRGKEIISLWKLNLNYQLMKPHKKELGEEH